MKMALTFINSFRNKHDSVLLKVDKYLLVDCICRF